MFKIKKNVTETYFFDTLNMVIIMNTIQWNNKKPKICVPIIETTYDKILEQAKRLADQKIDLVEWRIDAFEDIKDFSKDTELAKTIKHILSDIGLLITCRTQREGGNIHCSKDFYKDLYTTLCKEKVTEVIDIEYDLGKDVLDPLLQIAKENQIQVITSHHNFEKTPSKKQIIDKLTEMKQAKADIIKLACMPKNKEDVFALMEATAFVKEKDPNVVFITISMAKEGIPSRILGEFFGSSMTFASAGKQSAPGQVDVDTIRTLLDMFHQLQK